MHPMIGFALLFAAMFQNVNAGEGYGKNWNYDESSVMGPSKWNTNYPICGSSKQSPINIVLENTKTDNTLKPLELTNYGASTNLIYTLSNADSSIVVEVKGTIGQTTGIPELKFNGTQYRLAQFHFHWGDVNTEGSEHKLDGVSFPLETHLVHYNTKYASINDALNKTDGLLVWGQFVQVNGTESNEQMGHVTSSLKKVKHVGNSTDLPVFPVSDLIPTNSEISYLTYFGSLTTPSCDESVRWIVNRKYIRINQAQMDEFRNFTWNAIKVGPNFRPVQPLNGRIVTKFDSSNPTSSAVQYTYSLAVIILVVATQLYL